ncbi:type II toxin-antitoxin system CcdA family antitoxin [Archaeoglobus sulfaticallidus]|uniref:type II toxin-antitoxin system CcdA family antitoxin n=1 Tax=Archaeoglobus sulfaticallidus TaxID=1316941 RepID=UPI00373AEB50
MCIGVEGLWQKRINLTIDENLCNRARELGVNFSTFLGNRIIETQILEIRSAGGGI